MNNLREAKRLIKECQDTQNSYLDLGCCGITDLNHLPELFECTHLETLILSNFWWDNITSNRVESKNIGEYNTINSIPNKLGNLINLKKLILSSLGIFEIENIAVLSNCKNLKDLNLSNNIISDIHFLEGLTTLETLDLRHVQTNDIRFLENLTGLNSLYLSGNKISDIRVIEKLNKLKSLDLSDNQISDYRFLEKLTELHSLDLSRNTITDIDFLKDRYRIQWLNLNDNKITNFSFLENLIGLQTLYIANNLITDINFLDKLNGIQSLDLSENPINDYSCLKGYTKLQSLYLNKNTITDYHFIEKLTELKTLFLARNRINDIHFLEKLTKLKTLYIGYNQINDFSPLKKLTKLQSLYINSNQISDIHFLEKMIGLQSLDLRRNNIKNIPLSFFQLNMEINIDIFENKGISLYGNPIESPPLEIIKQGKQSVLDWFAAKKKKLNEIKIILIGEPKAGKTSLLNRLISDSFNKDEVQTDGITIEDIAFGECNTFKEQTSLHHLTGHFWDFGGQEIMNATHQFFLTKRSVYVLVLDARKDTNNSSQVREWVKRVKATGGDSPIIVLANQIDVNPGFGFENERELQDEFPQIKCFIKVSCSSNQNIDLFKEKLAELIPTAELLKTEIDERWITIKEKLQQVTNADYFLDETRFITICNDVKLEEKRKHKDAITFLHDLGLVLHFDDLNLSEYYVLNPYWITYGVYQILTSSYAGSMKGIVGMDKLEFIVNEEDDKIEKYNPANYKKITYSINQRRFLIDILQQFKLCFCTADHSHFIIPDLLDTKEPLEVTEPIRTSDDKIQFVYDYEYLPKSVMPNIMVETHHLIKEMWRTGCVLHNNSSKALITNYQNRITITVTGEHKKKREFMAVIRHILESIHQKLSNKPIALIPLPSVNAFAEYEVLLARERKGKPDYIFDEDKQTEKQFKISELLEGIPTNNEVLHAKINEVLTKLDNLQCGVNEINMKLDTHYNYLINLPANSNIKDGIQEAIKEMNAQQTAEITGEIMNRIIHTFESFDSVMDDKLQEIFKDLQKTDDVQMKLKLAIPFINMLGISFETEFDVKNWAAKTYNKHELKLFKLMGIV